LIIGLGKLELLIIGLVGIVILIVVVVIAASATPKGRQE
jgi:hypothetical protein